MLKQGLVQERIGDLTMGQLPPLNTLPQWSRVNNLDKARYPKPFVKDKLQPIPLEARGGQQQEAGDEDSQDLPDLSGMSMAQRIQYLERSLLFLRQQHSDVLRSLHVEVEGLKKENKDLQFKIIMSQKMQASKSPERADSKAATGEETEGRGISASSRQSKSLGRNSREDRLDELKVVFLEEEVRELKHALRDTRQKNTYIQQLCEQSEETRKHQQASLESVQQQMAQEGVQVSPQMVQQIAADGQSPLLEEAGGAGRGGSGRPLTFAECQAVIRRLQQVNERQAQELECLKSDLRDVLYSHKWTPDAYLLAKAYIAEDDKKDNPDQTLKGALPKIPVKNQTRKLPQVAYIRDTVALPALKQTVGNRAAERRKRTQILQKAKLRREIAPNE